MRRISNARLWIICAALFIALTAGLIFWMLHGDYDKGQRERSQIQFVDNSTAVAEAAKLSGEQGAPNASTDTVRQTLMPFYGGHAVAATAAPATQSTEDAAIEKALSNWRKACQQGLPITDSIIKLIPAPKLLNAFINDPIVVKLFIMRIKQANIYRDPQALASYAGQSQELSNLLSSFQLQSALTDKDLISSICASKLITAFAQVPSVRALGADMDAFSSLIRQNPTLPQLLSNPNFVEALRQNRATAMFADIAANSAILANNPSTQKPNMLQPGQQQQKPGRLKLVPYSKH